MFSQSLLGQVSALGATVAAAARFGIRSSIPAKLQLSEVTGSIPADLMVGTDPAESGEEEGPGQDTRLSLAEAIAQWAAKHHTQYEPVVEEAPIVRLANSFLQQAIKARASHMHVFMDRREAVVLCRIDGMMHHLYTMPLYMLSPLLTRLRVMAEVDLAARAVAQHGSIHVKYEGRTYVMPASFLGDRAVIEILDIDALASLDALGLPDDSRRVLENSLACTSGLILLTGPARSGRTTLMRGLANSVIASGRTAYSVQEAPADYIPGVPEIAIGCEVGNWMQSVQLLRGHDVDVLFCGDIRSAEAAAAVVAAARDYLVVASVAGRTPAEAIEEMVLMGVERAALSRRLLAITSQRLVRTVCRECGTETEVDGGSMQILGQPLAAPGTAVHVSVATGCDACHETGYSGERLLCTATSVESTLPGEREGSDTLLKQALDLVRSGMTTAAEAERALRA